MTGAINFPSGSGIKCTAEDLGIGFFSDGTIRACNAALQAGVTKPFRCSTFYASTWFGVGDPSYIRSLSHVDYGKNLHFVSQKHGGGWETVATMYGASDAVTADERLAISRAGAIIPAVNDNYDLGSAVKTFGKIYVHHVLVSDQLNIPTVADALDLPQNMRYDSETDTFEIYDGNVWKAH